MLECHAWYECHWSAGWMVAAAANTIIALAYMAIAWKIFTGMRRSGQFKQNRLGRATGAIFFTCSIGHGIMAAHLLLPIWGIEQTAGLAARTHAAEWHVWVWAPITGMAAVWYWTLRGRLHALVRGAALFEDVRERQRQALEIHDNIVQGLATAKISLEMGETDESLAELESTLAASRQIITDMLGEDDEGLSIRPGDLRRETPAGGME